MMYVVLGRRSIIRYLLSCIIFSLSLVGIPVLLQDTLKDTSSPLRGFSIETSQPTSMEVPVEFSAAKLVTFPGPVRNKRGNLSVAVLREYNFSSDILIPPTFDFKNYFRDSLSPAPPIMADLFMMKGLYAEALY